MNLSRFFVNGVSRPWLSLSRTTWLSGHASARREGGVVVPTGALTMTMALGTSDVPGTCPVTVYVPGAFTAVLSSGAGHTTRTSPAPAATTVGGSLGSMPTIVSTVTSGTCDTRDAKGDVVGIA